MRRARAGFTVLVALTCIALVGVALTLIGRVVTSDARRTGREIVEVQQRQLLLAGLRIVEARLQAGEPALAVGAIALPASLDATLRVDASARPAADRVVVVVRATVAGETLGERATFAKSAAWHLDDARIER